VVSSILIDGLNFILLISAVPLTITINHHTNHNTQPLNYHTDHSAAPGSKTAQLLESVMESDKFPDGLVIANDSDQKRAYMLVHQGKRLQTPCLMVTNHAAQEFPKIWMDQDLEKPYYLQFDRVLADVPCSGDGTLRKNKTIFATWNVNVGNSLHSLQLSILNRGCELLKVGGRLVYSTCTFNPIENEAVVAAMLNKGNGSFRLVDVSTKLKQLNRKPGLTKWTVRKNGQFYNEFQDGQELHESMFPPKNVEELGLENCIRVYPHLQNYGGFFVAVFEKTAAYGPLDKGKPPKNKKR
jgi:16S rRNA C967 or C1407 C5-methylase (RsmB/RsmF family)